MKAYAKINVFLKVVGTRGNYHEIASRFVLRRELFDEISFERASGFALECGAAQIADNIILKAKAALEQAGFARELAEFFGSHKIVLKKRIPIGAGLGGGSSDAAAFLRLANEELSLKISRERLIAIAQNIGADVAFFVSGLEAANVRGIGEIIEPFEDRLPAIEILTPAIFCSTGAVYNEFSASFMQNINAAQAQEMLRLSSEQLLAQYGSFQLNDLFAPCIKLYPQMSQYRDMFLSGSGSSVFFLK